MKYENTKRKRRNIYLRNFKSGNRIDSIDKYYYYFDSINHKKDIHIFSTDWTSWLDSPSNKIIEIELINLSEWMMPFIDVKLVTRVPEGEDEEETAGFIDEVVTSVNPLDLVKTYWNFSYVIRREEVIKNEYTGISTYKFFIVCYVEVYNWGNNPSYHVRPLEYKVLATFNNKRYWSEVRANKT